VGKGYPVTRSGRRILYLCLCLSFFSASASADIIDDLKARQAKIKTVSADFSQEKKTRLLTKPIRSEGRFLYKQPGKVRWEYRGGMNMQVVFNGKDIWIYYPDLKEADKLSGLAQYGSLMHFDIFTMSKDYTITARKDKGFTSLTFVPKAKGPVSRIEMEISDDTSFPRVVRLLDRNNEPATIAFRDVKINPEIKDTAFNFVPEKGVIVRERSLR
jgi:outer membrane lipoprotein carrier protein